MLLHYIWMRFVSSVVVNISPGLDNPQKDQVGWRGYLNPKSGSPASILGSPAIYSKKAIRFFSHLFMLVMVLMLFFLLFCRLHA